MPVDNPTSKGGKGGGDTRNYNDYETLLQLSNNGGQMAASVAQEDFPIGARVIFTDTDGTKNEFQVTKYTYLKNALTGDGGKRAVIPSLKRISGKYGIQEAFGSRRQRDSVKTIRDLAFSSAFAKGLGLKGTSIIIKK